LATLTLAFKGKRLQVFPLKDGLVTIGRDSGNDIHIDSLAVEPQHARLVINDGNCTLFQGKHDNTTYLNHKPIEEHQLEHNDIIRIGKHVLIYNNGDDLGVDNNTPKANNIVKPDNEKVAVNASNLKQPNSIIPTSGWLQVMNGKMLGKTFKLRSGLTDLGKLGMFPALIALRSSGYYISSLADTDDVSVADEDIGNKSHPLHDGDLIRLGKVTLQFHLQA